MESGRGREQGVKVESRNMNKRGKAKSEGKQGRLTGIGTAEWRQKGLGAQSEEASNERDS